MEDLSLLKTPSQKTEFIKLAETTVAQIWIIVNRMAYSLVGMYQKEEKIVKQN